MVRLYQGRSREALALYQQVAGVDPDAERRARASVLAAQVLLEKGSAALAVEQAQRAQNEKGHALEREGLSLEARAQARLGRWREAQSAAEKIKARLQSIPGELLMGHHYQLLGELALARGDAARAVEELKRAESLLPLRGVALGRLPPHVPIWFALASAHLAAGDEVQAVEWFRRVVESRWEHIAWPIAYVRSFYFLGKIQEERGEREKAREYYRRFLSFWKEGDLDRERVEEAKRKTGG
jgi:tetratricopeptide (TPR) repeat protein